MDLHLFPAPRIVTAKRTRLNLAGAEWIVLPPPCSDRLRARIGDCRDRIERALHRTLRMGAATPQAGSVLLAVELGAKLPAEGYELRLTNEGCTLRAGDEAGVFYGCLAFLQLIEQFGETPPALTIKDAPDFSSRGVMLDVSRCRVPTMATCRQLIDRLAGMRINQLQLYIEHTFAFSAHRTVWRDSSPFTHEEILELDAYCAERFIELVPNFNSFGHFGRWLKHPEYRALGECPDRPHCSTLAPNNASLRLIDSLYGEYLPHFTSRLFNVGCDETWELGTGRSKRKAEKTSTTRVYLDFLKKIHKLVNKRGRRMSFWGDIILHQPELIRELPGDILALCWGYDESHPYSEQCRAFQKAGVEYHVCPGTSAWNSITGRTSNALANIESAAKNGLTHGATGLLNTDWGDGGHHQVLPVSYLGYAAGAGLSWCFKANQEADLAGALDRHFFGGTAGVLGKFCIELGDRVRNPLRCKRRNNGAINRLLFWDLDSKQEDLAKITPARYDKAETALEELAGILPTARPTCEDADLVMNELRHALGCCRHALHRGRFGSCGVGDPQALHNELQELVVSHEDQWLQRNRIGGLRESTARLLKADAAVASRDGQ